MPFLLLVLLIHYGEVNTAQIFAIGAGVRPPIFSPLVYALRCPTCSVGIRRGYGRLRSSATGTFYSLGKRLRYY